MKTGLIAVKCLILTFIYLPANAQEWQGQFQTKYGALRLVQELGFEYPGGGMVYGDYGDKGTFVANFSNGPHRLDGYFHNGAASGKFLLEASKGIGETYYPTLFNFTGNYGYGENNNLYSTNADWQWTGKRNATSRPTGLKKAVWSGKWKTSFGDIILQQVGNKVTGKYKTNDRIEAEYNPDTRILKGTFTNGSQTGKLEFKIEGNKFTGKWGWGNNLDQGAWTGEKFVKSNAEMAATNPAPAPAPVAYKKYRIQATDVVISESGQNIFSADAPAELYGFAGFRVQRVTASKTENIASFGNQPVYYFDRQENNHVRVTYNKNTAQYKYIFPAGSASRDFLIPVNDLNLQNTDFYFTAVAHFKEADPGTNDDFGKKEIRLSLKSIQLGKVYTVSNSTGDGSYKLSFKIELVD